MEHIIKIVPLKLESATTTAVRSYRSLDDTIKARISDIIDCTMTAIYNCYMDEMKIGNVKRMNELKEKSNAVLTFAGMIQESVSREVYTRLMRMDHLMG
jgi:hypothetical protein